MTIERITAPSGAYSESVSASGSGTWVHIAGMLGQASDGQLVAGGTYEQALAALSGVGAALERAGAQTSHVVKITSFLTRLGDYPDFARARAEFFGSVLPASAAVEVSGLLLGALVEVEAVAFVPS